MFRLRQLTRNTGLVVIAAAPLVMIMASDCLARPQAPAESPRQRPQETASLVLVQGELMRPLVRLSRPVGFPSPQELSSIDVDPEVMSLVSKLDHSEYQQRESATAALRGGEGLRYQLYAVLARNKLSHEQRQRLLAVVHEGLLYAPRGAIGIIFPRNGPDPGKPFEIVVTDLVPGLPAERVLRIDDHITHVNGDALIDVEDFITRVQSARPGQRVVLTVKRAGLDENGEPLRDHQAEEARQTLELEMALGSADLLRDRTGNPPQGTSPVEKARQDEAQHAEQIFAPRPKLIEIRDQ